jgi:hypothetical protein
MISNAASSSSTPATPAHRGQPRSTAHYSHQSPNQLSRPLLVLPGPHSPSNFNQSTLAGARRPPPPPAHRGQLTPSLPAPPQPLSQHYINPVKLYDPFVGSLVHCIAFPMLAGVYLCCHRHCLRQSPLIRSVCSQLTHWCLRVGSSPVLAAGAPPSSLTPPPPLRALVEIPFPDHRNPRHVVQSDLAAGDPPRRNMAVQSLLPFCPWLRTSGLEELKTQGIICNV